MKKLTTRAAQWSLVSEFVFDVTDEMADVDGAEADFTAVGSRVVTAINLPTGAVVMGGEVVTEVALVGPTAFNITVGDSVTANRYLGATNRVTAGRTPLVPTGYVGNGENILVTVAGTVAPATEGRVSVRVQYVVRDRQNETVTH